MSRREIFVHLSHRPVGLMGPHLRHLKGTAYVNTALNLHPDAMAYLSARNLPDFPPEAHQDPVVAQAYLRELRRVPPGKAKDREIVGISNHLCARVYRPSRPPVGIIVYLHGGGFVAGDLDSSSDYCTLTAERAGAIVLTVDYRLAPEHPYPAATEDAQDAIDWTLQHAATLGAPPRLALVGASAGGAIAAGAYLTLDPSALSSVRHLTLFYPALSPALTTASARQLASGYGLVREQMRWFWDAYLGGDQLRTPPAFDAAPGLADDLTGLPPTSVIVAEFDLLRDDGAQFVAGARSRGVEAHLVQARGHVHGFLNYCSTSLDIQQYVTQAADEIRRRLTSNT